MKLKYTFLDYIFWIILILYSDPGGIQETFNINEIGYRINLNDILFVVLTLCYFIVPRKHYLNDPDFRKIRYVMLFFLFYFFVIYGYFTPTLKNTKDYSYIAAAIKMRYALYCVQLCLYIYVFFQRSGLIFMKLYFVSSILILVIYLQSIITGYEILPNIVEPRGFIDVDRNLMVNYGLMPFLIPVGISFIVFRINTRFRYYILLGLALMFASWLVSLTRRQIIGTVMYLIIALILSNYFSKGSLRKIFLLAVRIVVILAVLLMVFRITFPVYLKAGGDAIAEAWHVLKYGETSKGQIDERLKLSRPFIVEKFRESPYLGTGFDNRWKNEEGDLEGYEASDYPFLGAMAMVGILGILTFLPIYIFIIKILRKDILLLRKLAVEKTTFHLFIYAGILFFIFDLMKYTDYFSPVSLSGANQFPWYAYLGLYLGARRLYFKKLSDNSVINNNQIS